jgi:hypothetical protein
MNIPPPVNTFPGDQAASSAKGSSPTSITTEKPPKIKVKILSHEFFSEDVLTEKSEELVEDTKTLSNDKGVNQVSALSSPGLIEAKPSSFMFKGIPDHLLSKDEGVKSATKTTQETASSVARHRIYGNTNVVIPLLSEMWIFHIGFILSMTYVMTFVIPQNYLYTEMWNVSCYWKIGKFMFLKKVFFTKKNFKKMTRLVTSTSLYFNLLLFISYAL